MPGSCLLGGREKLLARLDPGPQRRAHRRPGLDANLRVRPVRPSGPRRCGIGRAAYEYALDYAKSRVQFGRPIIDNQGVAFALAD